MQPDALRWTARYGPRRGASHSPVAGARRIYLCRPPRKRIDSDLLSEFVRGKVLPEEWSPMKAVCVLLLASALAGCKSAPITSAPAPTLAPTAAASPNESSRPHRETVKTSDEQSVARVEQKRAGLQPGEQLVLVYQDVYPQWNTYTVTLTPQNEQAVLRHLAADSVKLAVRKPTRQAVIVFRSHTDEPEVWSYLKKRVAEAAGN
jgi:hypothetical protein